MDIELQETTFDADLDNCDTDLPWLKSLPALIPIPKSLKEGVAARNTTKETDHKGILTIHEVNEDLQQLLLQFEDEANKSDLQLQERTNEVIDDEAENRLLIVEPEVRKYTCAICKKEFQKPEYLSLHKRTHTGEKPYACDICPKRYRQKSHLNKHKTKHIGLAGKKHVCQICFKPFALLEGLKYHQETVHSTQKPFACHQCPMKFKQKYRLDMHQKRCHGGPEIMHHICQLCPKQFTSLRALKNHQVAHSPFGCFYCPSKFKYQASFWKHMKRVHPSMTSFSQETPTFKIAGNTCELCGFEPKTKNKSRERRDHLAKKHYRERIQKELWDNYPSCPLCEYIGKDRYTTYRHYIDKHNVVEQYLDRDIRAGRVETIEVPSAGGLAQPPKAASMRMKTKPADGATVYSRQGWSAAMAELALVNQVDQLTHQVHDVTTDQLMTAPYTTKNYAISSVLDLSFR